MACPSKRKLHLTNLLQAQGPPDLRGSLPLLGSHRLRGGLGLLALPGIRPDPLRDVLALHRAHDRKPIGEVPPRPPRQGGFSEGNQILSPLGKFRMTGGTLLWQP